jgi:hypothetical protein
MLLKEIKADVTIEKQILTGFIVSNELLHQFVNIIKTEYFESSYIREVIKWVLDYYRKHEESPKTYIQSIFDYKVAEKKIDEPQNRLIEQLLTELSSQFEGQSEVNINYYAEIIEEYFKKRELQITVEHVKHLLDEDRVKDAELVVMEYSKVARTLEDFINPLEQESIKRTFDERNSDFFKFPGALGDFLGEYERGWLIGISGPFKRGKTWYAQEFGVQSILSFRKVLFFSLEMSEKQMNERLYKRLTVTGDSKRTHRFPIFDCKHNQTGTCSRPDRENRETLFEDEESWSNLPPTFRVSNPYRPCTFCRDNQELNQMYYPAIWYEAKKRPKYGERRISLKLRNLKMYLPYIRYKCYPRFSANVSDLKRDVQMIEYLHDFVPDVIIVDYADILKPEDRVGEGFEKEDRTWIALSQLAMERNALVVSPTQVTKAGQDATQLTARHSARWVGKLGHVDAMIALNQTEKEQDKGLMRISYMAHRHKKFNHLHNCFVLQNLDLGQPHLDSEIQRYEENVENEDELD